MTRHKKGSIHECKSHGHLLKPTAVIGFRIEHLVPEKFRIIVNKRKTKVFVDERCRQITIVPNHILEHNFMFEFPKMIVEINVGY
jgi:hypothetical protein